MQRQSLGGGGSHGSKHNLYGEKLNEEEEKRRLVLLNSSSSDIEEEKIKVDYKHHHHHRTAITPFRTEKSIHLIPILTICCLLILYLCSYDPPQKDLEQFDGFRRISNQLDSSSEISGFGRVFEIEKGDVLPIRSHRSLHEIRKDGRRTRLHRKIGDF